MTDGLCLCCTATSFVLAVSLTGHTVAGERSRAQSFGMATFTSACGLEGHTVASSTGLCSTPPHSSLFRDPVPPLPPLASPFSPRCCNTHVQLWKHVAFPFSRSRLVPGGGV